APPPPHTGDGRAHSVADQAPQTEPESLLGRPRIILTSAASQEESPPKILRFVCFPTGPKHFSIWVVGWALWTAAALAQSPADRGGDSKVHLTPPAAAIAASTSSLDVSGTWSDTYGFTW